MRKREEGKIPLTSVNNQIIYKKDAKKCQVANVTTYNWSASRVAPSCKKGPERIFTSCTKVQSNRAPKDFPGQSCRWSRVQEVESVESGRFLKFARARPFFHSFLRSSVRSFCRRSRRGKSKSMSRRWKSVSKATTETRKKKFFSTFCCQLESDRHRWTTADTTTANIEFYRNLKFEESFNLKRVLLMQLLLWYIFRNGNLRRETWNGDRWLLLLLGLVRLPRDLTHTHGLELIVKYFSWIGKVWICAKFRKHFSSNFEVKNLEHFCPKFWTFKQKISSSKIDQNDPRKSLRSAESDGKPILDDQNPDKSKLQEQQRQRIQQHLQQQQWQQQQQQCDSERVSREVLELS